MLKIGDFSRLGHVTVKALRHYARIGLLKPAWIDRYNGYRYYNLQQLPRLNCILALKDLGFSLDQVADMVGEEVPVEQLRGMLRRKQAELEARLRSEQNRLVRVAARLQQIEQAGEPAQEVLLKRVGPLAVVSLRETVSSLERIPARMEVLVEELNGWLARSGTQPAGPWMALNPAPEYLERDIPLEVAVAVEPAGLRLAQAGGLRLRGQVLPAVEEMACLVHPGPLETLGQAYAGLYAWMEANRRRPAGPARELYLRDAGLDGRFAQVVEVQLPIEPAAAIVSGFALDGRKEPRMEPKIVNLPAFDVVGMLYQGRNQNQEIAAMWGDLNPRAGEIAAVPDGNAYGLCLMVDGLPEGCFEYVAGFEVAPGAPVPQGMVLRHVPAARYAVFAHKGSMETLHATFGEIFQTWLPQSGLIPVSPEFDMEVYTTQEFKGFAPDSILYIYVAVQ